MLREKASFINTKPGFGYKFVITISCRISLIEKMENPLYLYTFGFIFLNTSFVLHTPFQTVCFIVCK